MVRWRTTSRLRRASVIFLVLLADGACTSAYRSNAREVVLPLVSESAFRLRSAKDGAPSCWVVRADVVLQAVRGDTIHFVRAVPVYWPDGGARCTVDGPGYVDVAAHPELRVMQPQVSRARTAALAVYAAALITLAKLVR
jgi:hypothetical protein